MHSQKSCAKNRGFTLVELLVSVGIVALLAAVAVPQYSRIAAKSRQAEAMTALSALYSIEVTFATSKDSYSNCIRRLGYVPASQKRYYYVE